MKPFGVLLAELRKRAGLSQNDLAQILRTNPTHISKIERGERNPPKMKTLTEMAMALNLRKEEMGEFISSALGSKKSSARNIDSPIPVTDYINVIVDEEMRNRILNNPLVKLISEILIYSNIPKAKKREFEEKLTSFIQWLKEDIQKRDG